MEWKSLHTELRHILLSKNCSKLTSTVVTEVEEDNSVTLLDCSKRLTVSACDSDRLDELIGYTLVVRSLDSLSSRSSVNALALNEKVISLLDALPSLVTVHSIETTANRSNLTCRRSHSCLEVSYKALTALRVSVTTVHETVNEYILELILLSNVEELINVLE